MTCVVKRDCRLDRSLKLAAGHEQPYSLKKMYLPAAAAY